MLDLVTPLYQEILQRLTKDFGLLLGAIGLLFNIIGALTLAFDNYPTKRTPIRFFGSSIPERLDRHQTIPTSSLYNYIRNLDDNKVVNESNPAFGPILDLVYTANDKDDLPHPDLITDIILLPTRSQPMEKLLKICHKELQSEILDRNGWPGKLTPIFEHSSLELPDSEPFSILEDITEGEILSTYPDWTVFLFNGDPPPKSQYELSEEHYYWNLEVRRKERSTEIIEILLHNLKSMNQLYWAIYEKSNLVISSNLDIDDLYELQNEVRGFKQFRIVRGAALLFVGFLLQAISLLA